MYDFGDFDSNGDMGNPYIKLLSLVDPDTASAEFAASRGSTARTNITYNAAGSSGNSGTSSVSVSGTTADKLAQLIDYIPAMLAIMGLNALALLTVAAVGGLYLCKRRNRKSRKERGGLALSNRTPTPFPGQLSALGGGDAPAHRYERVSDNVPAGEQEPEDMPFTPPAPAFHAFENDMLRPLPIGSRPHSAYSGLPRDYRVSAAGSDVTAFVPPSPSFKKADMERPRSIA